MRADAAALCAPDGCPARLDHLGRRVLHYLGLAKTLEKHEAELAAGGLLVVVHPLDEHLVGGEVGEPGSDAEPRDGGADRLDIRHRDASGRVRGGGGGDEAVGDGFTVVERSGGGAVVGGEAGEGLDGVGKGVAEVEQGAAALGGWGFLPLVGADDAGFDGDVSGSQMKRSRFMAATGLLRNSPPPAALATHALIVFSRAPTRLTGYSFPGFCCAVPSAAGFRLSKPLPKSRKSCSTCRRWKTTAARMS